MIINCNVLVNIMIDNKTEENFRYINSETDVKKIVENNISGYIAIIVACILLAILVFFSYFTLDKIHNSVNFNIIIMLIVFTMTMCTISISLIERIYATFCKYQLKKERILIKYIEKIQCLNNKNK